MSDEWGPWIEHDGRGQPVPDGVYVRAEFDDGSQLEGLTGPYDGCDSNGCDNDGCWDWQWAMRNNFGLIIRYRIRKPRGLQILEALIAELPEEVCA